jgi:hypothetical protein
MLYNAPDSNKPIVADVRITCPTPVAASTNLTLTAARKSGRAVAEVHVEVVAVHQKGERKKPNTTTRLPVLLMDSK